MKNFSFCNTFSVFCCNTFFVPQHFTSGTWTSIISRIWKIENFPRKWDFIWLQHSLSLCKFYWFLPTRYDFQQSDSFWSEDSMVNIFIEKCRACNWWTLHIFHRQYPGRISLFEFAACISYSKLNADIDNCAPLQWFFLSCRQSPPIFKAFVGYQEPRTVFFSIRHMSIIQFSK